MSDESAVVADHPALAALAALTDALTAVVDAQFDSCTTAELMTFAQQWETHQRRATVVTHAVVAALGASGAPGEFGYRDTASLLADTLHLNAGEARSRVRAAAELGPGRTLLGESLAPQFTVIAAAQRGGHISAAHAKVIVAALDSLSPQADIEHAARVQSELVEHATRLSPQQLATAATRLLAYLDPDGRRPSDAEQHRRRSLTLSGSSDGSGYLQGRLTPELLATLQTVLDPLSAPTPAVDGASDPRTAEQRRHDGLLDLCQRMLRAGDLPDHGGVPTTLILTMSESDYRQRRGFATTPHGGLIPVADVRRLADQADITSVVLNASGGILDYGRTRRCASAAQRLALYARDGGCSFPGCSVPPTWTQAHHVRTWDENGVTAVDNLTLVCGHHHRNFEKMGWSVAMIDGQPWWTPPPHLDHQQKPRQNQRWRPPIPGADP